MAQLEDSKLEERQGLGLGLGLGLEHNGQGLGLEQGVELDHNGQGLGLGPAQGQGLGAGLEQIEQVRPEDDDGKSGFPKKQKRLHCFNVRLRPSRSSTSTCIYL